MKLIDKVIQSKNPPKFTNVIWVDTTDENKPVEKHFISGKWRIANNSNENISYIGSFDNYTLPELTESDAGKLAFSQTLNQYVTWNGKEWLKMDGTYVFPHYLTFTANEDASSVGFCCWSENYEPVDMGKNMQYSTDGGLTWQDYTIGVGEENLVPISIDEGESVMFRGINENLAYYLEDEDDYIYTKCAIEGSVSASGDITSLLNGIGGDATLMYCCYNTMFAGCTGLTTAPALPATTLASNCYTNMFNGCTGLNTAPALPATTLADYCYDSMFVGCTGLTTAPALPVTTLVEGCYNAMFAGCTGLNTAPALPATTLADYCYDSMFQDCTGIKSHNIATLNSSTYIFSENSSCSSLTIHAETPPTIAEATLEGLKADCAIYVPAASVDAYKAAQYWSTRASYIQAIPLR